MILSSRQTTALLCGLLALAAIVIYARSLGNSFVIWDDDTLVFKNPIVQTVSLRNIGKAFTSYDPELYVPLTIITFQAERVLFGMESAVPYHVDNLLLHILNCILVFFLLRKLGMRDLFAFLGAMIFTVHPLNTEAVAWVSARKDLLSTAFILGAALSWMDDRKRVSFGFLLLALLSKPIAVVAPVSFVLIDWLRGVSVKKSVTSSIPFFVLGLLFLIIGIFGKTRNIAALTLTETLLMGIKSTAFSLQKFLWPADISLIYLQTDPITLALPQFWLPSLALAALAALTAFSLRRTRVAAFGLAWYMLFLIPSFTNFAKDRDIYVFSDRYVYLSQIGLLFLLCYALDRILREKRLHTGMLGVTALPVLLLAWQAHARSLVWQESEILYRDALLRNDGSVVMHYNLGHLEHRRGDTEEARAEYERALQIDPQYAKALNNMGMLLRDEGRRDEAVAYFTRAMEADPRLPEPHNNLGSMYLDAGDTDAAIEAFRASIEKSDTFAQAYINLGSALGRKGQYEEGLRAYKRAFELAPQLLDGLPEIREALKQF